MKVMRVLILATISAAAVWLMGCRETTVVVRERQPEPLYVAQPAPQYVEVPEAPQPVIVETAPVSPGPDYVWIDGYWHWEGHHYIWNRGHWDRPPSRYHVWVRPSYVRIEHGYRYTPGHWREERHEEHHH